MASDHVLLMTDLVDSTRLTQRLGDSAAARLWQIHDRVTRDLLRHWRGREIDKSDGFLVLFAGVDDALGCAAGLHAALAGLDPPLLCRVGIHRGPLVLRDNDPGDVARGAKPLEVDGVAKAVAARIMALARGGQTLLSAEARATLSPQSLHGVARGHWRLKGLPEPVALFEACGDRPIGAPPEESDKACQVVQLNGQWRPVREVPNNLPAERDEFIGRSHEIGVLAQRFDAGARLVTVLGPGGCGKTRLALRFARESVGEAPGGMWFCDLLPARTLDGVLQAVAQGLGLTPAAGDPLPQIGHALAGRGRCLVLLDNFEQVARLAEPTLGRWLDMAPLTHFLVTSREVLGLRGEETLVLAPLQPAESAELFDRRARASHSGYRPGADDVDAIPRLMALLDHLPLAIELAAARVRVMQPSGMAERMHERFRLLTSSGRRHDRQATLRATLDWSWGLLAADEQSALAQLSVFEGSLALGSAEAVLVLGQGKHAPWTADVLQSLVEKSMLRLGSDGRFSMLAAVHDYAADQLGAMPPSAAQQARQRHWTHFASFDELRAITLRCADLGNLLVACQRAREQAPSAAVHLLEATWAALRLSGPLRAILALALELESGPALSDPEQAVVHRVMAGALHHLGDRAGAQARVERGLALLNDGQTGRSERSRLLAWRAELLIWQGEHEAAALAASQALALATECGDDRLRLGPMNAQGTLAQRESRLEAAATIYAQALQTARTLGDGRWQAGLLGNLGAVRHLQGQHTDALALYLAAADAAAEVGDRLFEANTRCNLGLLLHETGHDLDAAAALQHALGVARHIGHRRLECTVLCNLALVAEAQGQPEQALHWHLLAVTQAEALADPHTEGQLLGYQGLALARQGRRAQAGLAFGRARPLLEAAHDGAAQCLLDAQQALAAHLAGNGLQAHQLGQRAAEVADALGLAADAEPRRLLDELGRA